MDASVLFLFIPTFFLVSISPGMCMTLALTLGMSVGVRRTMYMMIGELLGVAIVAIAAVLGVAAIMLQFPLLCTLLKLLGGAYLTYIAIQMWRSKGNMAVSLDIQQKTDTSRVTLFSQGLLTAIANPKGWAFMISLLPPFISAEHSFWLQLISLVMIILCSEFICMMIYATGGKTLGLLLSNGRNVKRVNRISALLMFAVAIWLLVDTF
ncbi:LysE family translocator [Thalassotalea mangrovi]|uniref:LysE family translocator n=1 Tax=Thalassotalea mangrovi TaxID=2572245 RepID=A0A4U1B5R2_9GAMM|nr:LysE family translocator [Thalassotalea mangrovi]TKB45822.1 LysE family translocator [Thalassotalea mangrovi]